MITQQQKLAFTTGKKVFGEDSYSGIEVTREQLRFEHSSRKSGIEKETTTAFDMLVKPSLCFTTADAILSPALLLDSNTYFCFLAK